MRNKQTAWRIRDLFLNIMSADRNIELVLVAQFFPFNYLSQKSRSPMKCGPYVYDNLILILG